MSNPFAFEEDSNEDEPTVKSVNIPLEDSTSEDSDSSSVPSSTHASAGSDEYNPDPNAKKRMKRLKEGVKDRKRMREKTDIQEEPME